MASLKNLTMNRNDIIATEAYVDNWDGTVEIVNRYTETRTPHKKDAAGTSRRVFNMIVIRHRNDDPRKVLDLVRKEQKKDPRAVTIVNGALWSRADVELKYRLLDVDQLIEDRIATENLVKESELQPADA